MAVTVLRANNSKAVQKNTAAPPLLKRLREKKKISRTFVSKITQFSTYQVEGLEGPGTQNLLSRVMIYIKALGYNPNDLIQLMEKNSESDGIQPIRGALSQPKTEVVFGEGARVMSYIEERGCFLGQIQLKPGNQLNRRQFPSGDLFLGFVLEGSVLVDTLIKQWVYKKDNFFIVPGNQIFDILNSHSHSAACVLIFTVAFSVSESSFK